MGFLRRFGQAPTWPPSGPITWWPPTGHAIQATVDVALFEPDRPSEIEVVGESHYRSNLDAVAGGKTVDGPARSDHTAILIPEPDNPYDRNAVRVYLVPKDHPAGTVLVGYLSRSDAVRYRGPIYRLARDGKLLACPAHITGGWKRSHSDVGNFGVVLALDTAGAVLADINGIRVHTPEPVDKPPAAERRYATAVCPYCGTSLAPLPKAEKKCPSCGRPIFVRLGPDGYTYLLQEIDLPVLQEAWGEFHEAQAAAAAEEANQEVTRLTAAALDAYRALGVASVQLVAEDECAACSSLDGKVIAIAKAMPIPLPGCERLKEGDVCPCEWSPVVEWRSG